MEYITLDELKYQLRVDYDDEDALITLYGEAAERAVVRATERTPGELEEMGGGQMPHELKVAMLMLAATLYRQREAVSPGQVVAVPYALDYLIKPYVSLTRETAPEGEEKK